MNNQTIDAAFKLSDIVINNSKYKNIICSISGGSDSDIMLDMIHKVDKNHKVNYVWFNTGLEYQATKDHIQYLSNKYQVAITTINAIKPIPLAVKEYGIPFLSKDISEHIQRLQKYGFDFTDRPYEELCERYPECNSSIKWWCNKRGEENGNDSLLYNVGYKKYLKEFLIENPPKFNIGMQCCKYAKKEVSHQLIKQTNCDLIIMGIRRSEKGTRAVQYKNCYTTNEGKVDSYRPLFLFTDEDKFEYEREYHIVHSDCYKVWGFKRTGCVGCPFNNQILQDLNVVKKYEPQLYKAAMNIFGKGYDYTQQYIEFKNRMKEKEKGLKRLF